MTIVRLGVEPASVADAYCKLNQDIGGMLFHEQLADEAQEAFLSSFNLMLVARQFCGVLGALCWINGRLQA